MTNNNIIMKQSEKLLLDLKILHLQNTNTLLVNELKWTDAEFEAHLHKSLKEETELLHRAVVAGEREAEEEEEEEW